MYQNWNKKFGGRPSDWIKLIDDLVERDGRSEDQIAGLVRNWAEIIFQQPPMHLHDGTELPMPPIFIMSSRCEACDEVANVVTDYKIRINADSRYGYRLVHEECYGPLPEEKAEESVTTAVLIDNSGSMAIHRKAVESFLPEDLNGDTAVVLVGDIHSTKRLEDVAELSLDASYEMFSLGFYALAEYENLSKVVVVTDGNLISLEQYSVFVEEIKSLRRRGVDVEVNILGQKRLQIRPDGSYVGCMPTWFLADLMEAAR